jgi:cytochrome b subunit of formate dehydrogenase
MKKIYVVFECNAQRSYASYCIKLLSTNRELAERLYNRIKSDWIGNQDSSWYLNMAEYVPNVDTDPDANAYDEFELILTTENDGTEQQEGDDEVSSDY